ncbi:MAG: hypothetical protein Q9201_004091 [Fulgogasparrea decipioides]
MNVGKAPPCVPTWRGYVETTKDALLIFEACFNGTLAHCFRRPHDRERTSLIVSGNVFVYEEATSGIKRWTDGIPWSPSRILTNFLIYRQLNSPFPPGEKKRATKRSQRVHKPGEPYPSSTTSTNVKDHSSSFSPESPGFKSDESADKDGDRTLVGSLIDSYEFKKDGLLKKTMTVTIKGVQHHLVSYYNLEDAKHNLKTPRDDSQIKDLVLRRELLEQPKFKFQNLDDAGDGVFEQAEAPHYSLSYPSNSFDSSRSYPAANHAHGSFLDSATQYYYPTFTPYLHTPNGIPYSTVPTTSTAYAPVPQASTYATSQGHSTSSQYASHVSRSQSYHHVQQQSHQPSQHQQHVTSPRSQHMQASNGGHFPSAATLPRPNSTFDMGSVAQESNGVHHGAFESYNHSTTPLSQTGMYQGMPQLSAGYMNAAHTYAARPDGSSQPYRAF